MSNLFTGYPPPYVKPLACWNDKYITDPVTVVITELVAPIKRVTPTHITLVAFVFSLVACWYYAQPGRASLLWGAAYWQINYFLDGVDGKLARKRQQFSRYGAQLDLQLDKVKKAIALVCLWYAHGNLSYWLLGLIALHYALMRLPVPRSARLRCWFNARGIRSSFSPLDQLFLVLFVGPLTGAIWGTLAMVVVLQILDHAINWWMFRAEITVLTDDALV